MKSGRPYRLERNADYILGECREITIQEDVRVAPLPKRLYGAPAEPEYRLLRRAQAITWCPGLPCSQTTAVLSRVEASAGRPHRIAAV